MPTPQLPKTDVRLSTSASFYILREDAVSAKTILGGSYIDTDQEDAVVQNALSKMVSVYAITYFQESQERQTMGRFEVDSDVPGKALEIFEQPLERTISLKRGVLYSSDLMAAIGYENELKKRSNVADASILSQLRKPFILIKKDTSPSGESIMTLYRGCILQRLSKTYDLRSDLAVIEDVSIRYAGRQQIKI